MPDRKTILLAVPEVCADKIIILYHTSLFAGHQAVMKTYFTIDDKFFIPGLMHYFRSFIKGCHTCQLVRMDKLPMKQLQIRIYCIIDPCQDFEHGSQMPRSQRSQIYFLCNR